MIKRKCKSERQCNHGSSSILALIFVSMFSVVSISFVTVSDVNVQLSCNHRDMVSAQTASESGLEYALYLVNTYVPPSEAYSGQNTVSEAQALQTFGYFANQSQATLSCAPILDGAGVSWNGSDEMRIPATGGITLTGSNADFSLFFEFVPGDSESYHLLQVTSTGTRGGINRSSRLSFPIRKDSQVLEYAIASRGRMWITGDSTIHGDVFSAWDRSDISPFNMTSDSAVMGTINTVLALEDIQSTGNFQMETLDENNNPMFDEEGNRIYSEEDEIQGYHEGINYDAAFDNMPGMNIEDYDTDDYKVATTNTIPSCPEDDRITEYFPHTSGDYTWPRDGSPGSTWNRELDRHVYENQTFTNALLPDDRDALFINCTFEDILYIDCDKGTSSDYNNVRFQDCTFNGVIVTDVPDELKWQHNCLYFTGSATFDNTAMEEATILAPHFNVNLGNANPIEGEENVLTGAIVGGIVDVRGNAQIYGTIISMCDTTQWSGGYVTNIGATLNDGGSETTEAGDIGVISITPDEDMMLPSGITTPIILARNSNSYTELGY